MSNIPYNIGDNSITAFFDGRPHTIRSGNASFNSVREALLDGRHEEAKNLFNAANAVKSFGKGKLEVVGNSVFYEGHELHGVEVDKLLSQIKDGIKDVNPLINFITRNEANISSNSKNELFNFLSYRELPITPEGYVLAYKYIADDYYSCHGNKRTRVIQGKVDEGGRIFNGVGEVIEVDRRDVDDNMHNHCSHGLHVGSFNFAKSPGNRMIVVKFDPADAVSVPTDCNFQKLRVCKYEVISEITDNKVEIEDSVYSDDDDYDPYADYDACDDIDDECDGRCGGGCLGAGCGEHDDLDDEPSWDEDYVIQDNVILTKIEDYIEKRFFNSSSPSLKEVQSRMKGYPVSCKEIYHTAKYLGYNVGDYNTSHNTYIRES